MQFTDVFSGEVSERKQETARAFNIKIAPGDFSLLISKSSAQLRKQRRKVNFIAGMPESKQEMNSLLTDTHYDFMIVNFSIGKRNIRMAKRHETAIAIPLSNAMSLKISDISHVRRNLVKIQEIGGKLLLCSGAKDFAQIRSGEDLAAIGVLLGLRSKIAIDAVSVNPLEIIKRNEKLSKQEVYGVSKTL